LVPDGLEVEFVMAAGRTTALVSSEGTHEVTLEMAELWHAVPVGTPIEILP
jgi:hypothetical protein